jgi:CBS domain-containing protein
MSKTASEVMTSPCECVGESQTVADAAKKLSELGVGSMPICGDDDKLKGMLTDRDIVVKVIAEGKDPSSTQVSELAEGVPVTIGEDDSVEDALKAMSENQVRRLPVLDSDKKLTGIVSQADVAKNLEDDKVGDLVAAISKG